MLGYVNVAPQNHGVLFLKVAQTALADHPEFWTAYDGLYGTNMLGVQHKVMAAIPVVLNEEWPRQIASLPGIEESVRRIASSKTDLNPAQPDFSRTGRIVKALVEAGRSGKDTVEPSWAVLGQVLREEIFLFALRNGEFLRWQLTVPSDSISETLDRYKPLLAGHRFAGYVASFALDKRYEPGEYTALLKNLPLDDVTFVLRPLLQALYELPTEKNRAQHAYLRAGMHLDGCADDLMTAVFGNKNSAYVVVLARALQKVSPHSPIPYWMLIEHDWKNSEAQAAEWEKRFKDAPVVQGILGERYFRLHRWADAERCARASLALSPDKDAYDVLADVYLQQGQLDRWQATLDDFLKTEDVGLEHARVRVQIARRFMGNKQWDKAWPYAEAAAGAWAQWAMQCASECAQGMGNMEQAELWVRRSSERYESGAMEWYCFCVRTGKGAIDEARKLAAQRAAELAESADFDAASRAGLFYMTADKLPEALAVFRKIVAREPLNKVASLWTALLADMQKDTKTRDEALKSLQAMPAGPPSDATNAYQKLGGLFAEALAGKELQKLAVDKVVDSVPLFNRPNLCFLAGRFQEVHGKTEEAILYYKMGALNPGGIGYIASFQRLRALGVKPPVQLP
jgi:tetratricopeptide (TPR) repeat protein